MSSPKRLVLVDGSALIFRAYFAIPANLATKTGLHTNAIFGFATMFRKLFSGRKPDYGAVVFDSPVKTFREEKYPQYKAHRPPLPDDLGEQLPWIDRLMEVHQFPRLRLPGFEADDVIGTLTRMALESGMEVVIVSSDKDFAQLVSEQVKMLDTLRDVSYDPELVRKKWGVPPSQIVDLLALMGDSSDAIPGVSGIGQKGAAQLLEKYGSLDGILAHTGELKGRQKQALQSEREIALLSRDLATIDCRAPVAKTIEELAVAVPDASPINALYRELEFFSLLSEESKTTETSVPETCEIIDSLVKIPAALAALGAHSPVALIPIYELPSPIRGGFVGLALVGADLNAFYLPLGGEGGLGQAGLDACRAWLEDPQVPKISHNVKELWELCSRWRVELKGVVGDTMLASFLIEPTKLVPHRLDQLAREFLHRTLRSVKELTGSGQKEHPLSQVPLAELASWGAHLARAVAEVWPIVAKRLEELEQVRHLREHELPLTRVLGAMELAGIRVDGPMLKQVGIELAAKLLALEQDIHGMAGHAFNIGSTKQLAEVLFEELKLPVIKRTKTGYSTDSEVLERLAPKHRIAEALVEHRKLAKLINTYTDVLQAAIDPSTGRVHATLQQTVGASGRLISTDPDLQRTPIKTPEGKRIREAFVADPGNKLISADWSQIELRVLAHVSRDPLLVDSFRHAVDVHRRTASQIFHCAPEAVTHAQRAAGKTVNFATIYGQGATALGQILGIPRKEAQSYIDGYFAAYAGVRTWLDATIADAHDSGFVTTLLGRRRYIPELFSKNPVDNQAGERIAANTPIQGSAADLCKLAMLLIAKELSQRGLRTRMLLQIHDELVFEAPEDEVAAASELVRRHMEHAYLLEVPLVVDLGVGQSWAEAH